MSTIALDNTDLVSHQPHGELDCADAESILRDVTANNQELRHDLTVAAAEQDRLACDLAAARLEADRLRALLAEVNAKHQDLMNERDDLRTQVKFLHEELAAVEADAVPQDTLVYAPISRDQMTALYRQHSRITRGPLPPAVVAAVEAAQFTIVESMQTAGRDALATVIRREVRRRRRAATRGR